MAFTNIHAVTVDHTKVPNTDQTDFPVLFMGTYADLKTVGNGGLVQDSNGYDIGFYSDSAATTKLKWEIEYYDATTGDVVYWIKIPTLETASDHVFYIAFGDAAINTDRSDPTNVWDSNFKGVYHLSDGTTLNVNDSTSNANNMTNTGAGAVSGQIDGGASFNGSSQRISKSSAIATGDVTFSAWFYPNNTNASKTIVCIGFGGAGLRNILYMEAAGNGKLAAIQFINNSFSALDGDFYSASTWQRASITYTSSTGAVTVKLNGNTVVSGTISSGFPVGTDTTQIGAFVDTLGGFLNWFNGNIDEVKISNIVRSDDWEQTEYNNQSSPSTFYAVGANLVPSSQNSNFLQYL